MLNRINFHFFIRKLETNKDDKEFRRTSLIGKKNNKCLRGIKRFSTFQKILFPRQLKNAVVNI